MNHPHLSVVIPAYQDPYRLSFVLKGLTFQHKPLLFEVIVVDSGTIPVSDLVANFSSLLPITYKQIDSGPDKQALARNFGLKLARAPRTLFLDQDSIPAPNLCGEHSKYEESRSMIAGFRVHVPANRISYLNGEDFYPRLDRVVNSSDYRYFDLAKTPWYRGWEVVYFSGAAFSCNLSVPTELARLVGGFWEDMDAWGPDDQEFASRLGKIGVYLVLRDDVLVYHLDHPMRPFSDRIQDLYQNSIQTYSMYRPSKILPPYNHNKDKPHFQVLSMASKSAGFLSSFLKSARRFESEPILLGMGMPFRGWGAKLNLLYQYLKDIQQPKYIIWADAFDSIFQRAPIKLLETFLKEFSTPLVFSGDSICWPDQSMASQFPQTVSPFRWLNAGQWVGETSAVIEMLTELGCPLRDDSINDQSLIQQYFLAHRDRVSIDYHSKLFLPLNPHPQFSEFNNHLYHNRRSKEIPFLLHGSGGFDLTSVISNLGL